MHTKETTPYIGCPVKPQARLHSLVVLCGYGLLLGTASLLLLMLRWPDSILLLFAIPIVLVPLFSYGRRLYLSMSVLLAAVAVWITFTLSTNIKGSLFTITFSTLSIIIITEIVFYLFRLRRQTEKQLIEAENELKQRNRELELFNRASRAFASTLDLDRVLVVVLEKVRNMLDVTACSIWLIDTETNELVCQQATGSQGDLVRGWRLAPGEGLAGWVVQSGESLIVPDTQNDARFFKDVDRQTGLISRSILTVPLKANQDVAGVIQVLDTQVGRFRESDLAVLEPLAAAAAVAIDNARLYQDADRLGTFNKNIVQSMNEGILLEDAEGIITFANPRIADLLGYTQETLVGRHWTEIVPPEHIANIESENTIRPRNIASRYETALLTHQGEQIPVIVSATSLFQEDRFSGVLSVHTDISERVRTEQELRASEARLERARRIESLSTLAGGVAHDLNNILGPIVAYPDLILEALPEQDSLIRQDVLQIQRSAEKAIAVIQDLLALARRGIYHMQPLSLNVVVRDYMASPSFVDLHARYPGVTTGINLASNLWNVLGSTTHLSKVVMNLVTNAFEAIPGDGRITVHTANERLEESYAGYEHVPAGDYVILQISDTGTGIEQHDLPRIFEPFYTKKEMGRSGSGLGLAVVYGVTRDHDARIDLQTKVGTGTKFTFYFPVANEAISDLQEPSRDYSGNERVLVIDDLEEQRALAVRLLSSLGYRAEAVDSGRAAVAYLGDRCADVLVLDMIMEEGFDGLDTYREIVRLHPGQKAVIASGFSKTERVEQAQQLGAGPFIRKPYTSTSLGKAIRQALDHPAAPVEREEKTAPQTGHSS